MKKILLLMLCMLLFSVSAAAKEKPVEPLPEDFGSRGLLLGHPATEEQMTKAFGAPLFDNDISVYGIRVRYYQFQKDIKVGILLSDGTVCDIVIRDEAYEGRDGVRYGATPYKITHTYGPCDRTFIEGRTWYIYRSAEDSHQKLMLETLGGIYTLVSWRITSLPLTLAEAETYEEALWEGRNHGIDTSALDAHDQNPEDRWKKGRLKK